MNRGKSTVISNKGLYWVFKVKWIKGTPIQSNKLLDSACRNHVDEIRNKKFSHSRKLRIVFEIVAEKFMLYFEGEKCEIVRKILLYNVHWKARDDLLKLNVTVRGSTTVTILIPLCKEMAKFQYLCWTTLKDSKMVLTEHI